jgi:DNA (cytosine-5)-methyltransferase 1
VGIFETVIQEKYSFAAAQNSYVETAVIDCFAGCGGMSAGFHHLSRLGAPIEHLAAFDNDEHSVNTFNKNIENVARNLDLSNFEDYEIFAELKGEIKKFQRTILIGCAPCQGFSSLTKGNTNKDERNNLLLKFSEIISFINPDIFIVENVPDLFSHRHRHVFKQFEAEAIAHGYKINSRIVNMADYGVPQQRYRSVIIGHLDKILSFPKKLYKPGYFKTVRNAIERLPKLDAGEVCNDDPMHQTSKHRSNTVQIFKSVPIDGGSRPPGVGPACLDRVKGYYDVYGRLFWDKPAVTITARCRTPSCGRFTHPSQHRGLSVREAALLQSFPSDFQFSGPFDDRFKQIGNAVPPLFSLALADNLCRRGLAADLRSETPEPFQSFGIYIAHDRKKHAQI